MHADISPCATDLPSGGALDPKPKTQHSRHTPWVRVRLTFQTVSAECAPASIVLLPAFWAECDCAACACVLIARACANSLVLAVDGGASIAPDGRAHVCVAETVAARPISGRLSVTAVAGRHTRRVSKQNLTHAKRNGATVFYIGVGGRNILFQPLNVLRAPAPDDTPS